MNLAQTPGSGPRIPEERPGRSQKPEARSQKPEGRSLKGASAAAPSWWTARARSGDVSPGFSKAEILKPEKDDPRQPDGVFARVGALLSELSDRM
jgi:hypothetical protein